MRSLPQALEPAVQPRLSPSERKSLFEAAASDRRWRRRRRVRSWVKRVGTPKAWGGRDTWEQSDGATGGADPLLVLARAEQNELDYDALLRRLSTSWLYPVALFTAAVTVCALAAPNQAMMNILEDIGVEAPPAQRFLLWWNFGMWPAIAAVTYAFAGTLLFAQVFSSVGGDRLVWAVPLVGRAHRLIQLSAMSRSVAILVQSGHPLASALATARGSVRSASLRRWLRHAAEDEAAGRGLQAAIRRIPGGDEILSAAVGDPAATGIPLDRGWWLAARYYHQRAHRYVDLARFSYAVLGYLLTALVITSLLTTALLPIVMLEIIPSF